MKNKTIGILLSLLVVGALLAGLVAGGLGLYFWWSLKGGSVAGLAKRLPPDTSGLIVLRGFGDIALEFRGLADDPNAKQPDNAAVKEFQEVFGFAPNDPEGWASTGLDFSKPWGMALSGMDPDEMEFTVLVPVADEVQAQALVQRLLEKSEETVTPQTFGEKAGFVIGDDSAVLVDEDHIVLVGSERGGYDASTAMRVYLDRDYSENLWGQDAFQAVLNATQDGWHGFAYTSPALASAYWEEADADAREVFGSLGRAGSGFSLALHDEAITTELVSLSEQPLPQVLAGGKDPLSDGLSGVALGVLRLGFDWREGYSQLKSTPDSAEKLDKLSRDLRDEWGVDLETDIVQNLDGPVTLVALAGNETPDIAAWVPLRDAKKTETLLDAVTERLRQQNLAISTDRSDGQVWHFKDSVGVGVVKDSLVVAVGQGRMAQVRADLGQKPQSFMDTLPAAARTGLRSGPPLYLYVDMVQTLQLLSKNPLGRNFMPRDARKAARGLSGVSFGVEAKGNKLVVRSDWHAPEGGFTQAIREAMAAEAKMAEMREQRELVRNDLNRLRDAMRVYQQSHGAYMACGSEDEAKARASAAYDWAPTGCWAELDWAPTAPVRGGFWITTSSGWFSTFRVNAVMDLDGDGEQALLSADLGREARVTTDDEVY